MPQAQGSSVTNTTAIAYGTTSGAGIVMWLFACLQAGHLVPPDTEVAMAISATLVPLAHAVVRRLTSKIAGEADAKVQ